MQLAIQLNFLNDFPPISLERCPEIMQIDPRQLRHHPVGGAAGNLPHQPVIAARIAPAADQVEAFFDFLEKAGNLFGIVLQVAIHGNDDLAPREIKSRLQPGRLAEISPQSDDVHTMIVLVNIGKHLEGVVPAAVVHEHQFVGFADGIHYFGDLHVQGRDIFLLVEEGNDHRVANCGVSSHVSLATSP